jgi:molecular chaperone DnaK
MTVNGRTLGLETTLTQSHLIDLILPYITASLDICETVLQEAKLHPEHIDQVILVGGQTRTPILRDAIRERFGWKLNTSIDPDRAVGMGAAIMGARLCGQLKEQVKLWDVIPLSLGIELADGRTEHIVKANEQIPITVPPKSFTTQRDGQEVIRFRIVQGERTLAKDNTLIGEVTLPLTTARPKGEHRIKCMFKVDQDGILHVRAEDTDTEGDPIEAMVDHVYRLSPEEVDTKLREAEEYTIEDQRISRLLYIQEEMQKLRNAQLSTSASDDLFLAKLDDLDTAIITRDLERAERLLQEIRSTL